MATIPGSRRSLSCAVILSLSALTASLLESDEVHARQTAPQPARTAPRSISLPAAGRESLPLGRVLSGETYGLLVNLEHAPADVEDHVRVELAGPGADRFTKELHAGDPDLYLPYRPREDGQARLSFARTGTKSQDARLNLRFTWDHLDLPAGDRAAIEAEPNDSWQQANELRLGRDVYGTGDDVDYLENHAEGKTGLDWFRFEVKDEKPILVYFQLDSARSRRLSQSSGLHR